jgi:hypothetical protein
VAITRTGFAVGHSCAQATEAEVATTADARAPTTRFFSMLVSIGLLWARW